MFFRIIVHRSGREAQTTMKDLTPTGVDILLRLYEQVFLKQEIQKRKGILPDNYLRELCLIPV